MKRNGTNQGEAARSKILPLFGGADAMAVLSQQVRSALSMPACIRAALMPTIHESRITVALRGGMVIGGLGVELIFRSGARSQTGIPRDQTTKAILLPAGRTLVVEDRSPGARAGSDPAAWVQVRDGSGAALTDARYIGRLGKGPCLMDPTFSCPVTAETYVSPFSITEPADSDLTLTGEMTFDLGITLRVTLRRREGALWWGRRPDAVFDFEILPRGTTVHFPAQPIGTGCAGSLRSLIFLDGEGDPIGNEHVVTPTVALQ